MFSPTGGSPVVIFLGTAWLVARRWGRLRAAVGRPPQRLAGGLLLALASVLCTWAYYVGQAQLLLPALTMAALGSALWLGGLAAARAILLPSLFVLLAVPVPSVLVNQIIYPLQLATAQATAWILQTLGLGPAVAQGDRILRGGAVFEVIESCSGLRSVETIFMASFLYHDLFFRSRLQSTLLILASPLLGILANQIRVLTIVLNPYSRFAAVHTAQGLVMIVLAVLMLAGLDWLLTRLLPEPARTPRRRRAVQPPSLGLATALAGALAALAAVTLWIRPWDPPRVAAAPLSALPAQIEDWQAEGVALDKQFLGSATFSEWVHRRYTKGEDRVDLLLGSDDHLDARINFHSIKTAVPDSGWEIERESSVSLASGRTASRLVATSGSERQLVYLWTEGMGSPLEETVRALFALDRGPFHRPGRALLVRLTTIVSPSPAGRVEAEERLAAFAAVVERAIPNDGATAAPAAAGAAR